MKSWLVPLNLPSLNIQELSLSFTPQKNKQTNKQTKNKTKTNKKTKKQKKKKNRNSSSKRETGHQQVWTWNPIVSKPNTSNQVVALTVDLVFKNSNLSPDWVLIGSYFRLYFLNVSCILERGIPRCVLQYTVLGLSQSAISPWVTPLAKSAKF